MTTFPAVYEMNATGPFSGTWNGAQWWSPTSYTSHSFVVPAIFDTLRAEKAIWRMCWTATAPAPGSETGIVRLFTRTPNTTAPKVPIAQIKSSMMANPGQANISNDAVDITTEFNAFLDAGQNGHFSWDFIGNNTNPMTFHTSRLEVSWKLPETV